MLNFGDRLDPRKILSLCSRGIPYYLDSWRDLDGKRGLFGSTQPSTYNMQEVASSSPVIEYVVQPHLQVCCILASYIHGNQTSLLKEHISRDELIARTTSGLRWACDTHLIGSLDVDDFLDRRRWGENWRSSLWATQLAICATLMRDHIEPELLAKVKCIVAFEADRFIDLAPPTGFDFDTKLEENAIDTMLLCWAVNLCPDHDNHAEWEQALQLWSINIATSIGDRCDHSEYFGNSIAGRVSTQTLFPDMTAENHGFFHPDVLTYSSWVVLGMAAYTLNGSQPPSYLRRSAHHETFEILLRFCLPTGMDFSPAGQDIAAFVPRPFKLAWGLFNKDPRAIRITGNLLDWMDALPCGSLVGPWVFNLSNSHDGWDLFYQSQVGFDLAMLTILQVQNDYHLFTPGQMENAIDTRQVYPYIEICYRRNMRTTRSFAWKALNGHPLIGFNIHAAPELVYNGRAHLLGAPTARDRIQRSVVAFHTDRITKDGFETNGQILYIDFNNEVVLKREVRVLTWGDEGLCVFDLITSEKQISLGEQFLSTLHLVNDQWTGGHIKFTSGSLREIIPADKSSRELSCPSYWASVKDYLMFQLIYGRNKGLIYLPAKERNTPHYWKNCRIDTLALRVDAAQFEPGDEVYRVGYYLGTGKGPRPFKVSGEAGRFFRGLVIMDGKNTIGLD